jgi:hypothetical protein
MALGRSRFGMMPLRELIDCRQFPLVLQKFIDERHAGHGTTRRCSLSICSCEMKCSSPAIPFLRWKDGAQSRVIRRLRVAPLENEA